MILSSYDNFISDDGIYQWWWCYLLSIPTHIYSWFKYRPCSCTTYLLQWLGDLEYFRNGKEQKHRRCSFHKKSESKVSNCWFQRIYRMTRASFDKLHSILEPRLNETFFHCGGSNQKKNKSRYLIGTKTPRLLVPTRPCLQFALLPLNNVKWR